jgi:WD40 repeat protein
VLSVAFSSNNRRVASGSDDRTVRIWDTATGDSIAVLQAENLIENVRFCRGDSQVAVIDNSGTFVNTWDLQSDGFPKIDEAHPPVFHVDNAGWLWGSVVPNGPTRRIVWLPPYQRPVRAFLPDILERSLVSSTNILTFISNNGLLTYVNLSGAIKTIKNHMVAT